MKPDPLIDMPTATRMAGVHEIMIQLWCVKYGVGRVGFDGGWVISRAGVQDVMRSQIKLVAA